MLQSFGPWWLGREFEEIKIGRDKMRGEEVINVVNGFLDPLLLDSYHLHKANRLYRAVVSMLLHLLHGPC
jgi:hypothetical protein